jgi:hypothetical protein
MISIGDTHACHKNLPHPLYNSSWNPPPKREAIKLEARGVKNHPPAAAEKRLMALV